MLVTHICKLAKKQVISNAALPREIFCSQNIFLSAKDIANGEMVFVLHLKHVSSQHVSFLCHVSVILDDIYFEADYDINNNIHLQRRNCPSSCPVETYGGVEV
jgi:hypothetical protein